MFKIQKLNNISSKGLDLLPSDKYEHASEIISPDAILVRSADMLEMELPPSIKAIARAGAGINNIPVEYESSFTYNMISSYWSQT